MIAPFELPNGTACHELHNHLLVQLGVLQHVKRADFSLSTTLPRLHLFSHLYKLRLAFTMETGLLTLSLRLSDHNALSQGLDSSMGKSGVNGDGTMTDGCGKGGIHGAATSSTLMLTVPVPSSGFMRTCDGT